MTVLPRDVTKLTADQILSIDESAPEKLFARNANEITRQYRLLAKAWYPDVNRDPDATDVFQHITRLREKAEEKLAKGTWQEAGYFTCKLKDGRSLRVRSDARRDFELGTTHISPTTLTFVIGMEHADLFQNAVTRIGALKFLGNDGTPDPKIEDAYASCLPTTFKTYETEDALILTVRKRPDDIRLRDLLPHLPKDTLGKHVAWITSRMHEMARYLDHAGIAHNAMTLDTIYASPSLHTIGLFGGWWYAKPFGEKLEAVPGEAAEFLPDTGKSIPADGKTDREMLRAAARELLGDRDGTRLMALKTAPTSMTDYLRQPSSGDPQTDLRDWYQTVLPKSFGARRFTELPVTYSDVYQPGG
ncbi:MAG: hypothetical protein AB7H77_06130 [Bdellovibrionales bacterium]